MSHPKVIDLTDENVALLKDVTISSKDLAVRLGCTETALWYWRRKLGINRMEELRNKYYDEVIYQWQNGDSIEEIRSRYSAPSHFVTGILRDAELIEECKTVRRKEEECEHFDYRKALYAEYDRSSGYLSMDVGQYMEWIKSGDGLSYFLEVQGHPLEWEYCQGRIGKKELREYLLKENDGGGGLG